MNIDIKLKKLKPEVKLPSYAHPGDAGMDLYSLEDYKLQPGERRVFYLGFAIEFPTGYAGIIQDKGSLPKNGGLHVIGGVYDDGFRGEYNVMLINLGQESFKIAKGQKIAQLIFYPVAYAQIIETDTLSESSRGNGNFGSTGKF